jgi:ABC-2 type transport system permease protein
MADEPRPGALGRLAALWRLYAYMEIMWVTRDLRSVVFYYLSDLTLAVATISATLLLAERFDGIGQWTKPQILFMLGYATAVQGLLDSLFSYNILFISRRLGRGQLDHTLVQPQPLWMSLLTEGFSPLTGSVALLPAAALLAWALAGLPPLLTPGWLALALLNLLASAAIVLAFSVVWGSLAFWAPRAAEEVSSATMRAVSRLKPFPLDSVGPALTGGLLTAVPAGFVAWYPCRALLGLDPAPFAALVTPLAALLFALLAAWLFRQGLRRYARVGSSRYSDFGFRR